METSKDKTNKWRTNLFQISLRVTERFNTFVHRLRIERTFKVFLRKLPFGVRGSSTIERNLVNVIWLTYSLTKSQSFKIIAKLVFSYVFLFCSKITLFLRMDRPIIRYIFLIYSNKGHNLLRFKVFITTSCKPLGYEWTRSDNKSVNCEVVYTKDLTFRLIV